MSLILNSFTLSHAKGGIRSHQRRRRNINTKKYLWEVWLESDYGSCRDNISRMSSHFFNLMAQGQGDFRGLLGLAWEIRKWNAEISVSNIYFCFHYFQNIYLKFLKVLQVVDNVCFIITINNLHRCSLPKSYINNYLVQMLSR